MSCCTKQCLPRQKCLKFSDNDHFRTRHKFLRKLVRSLFRSNRSQSQCCWPELGHAVQELFPAELALCGCSKLPRHHQDAHAGWFQHQVIAELLDPINTYLVFILRVCKKEEVNESSAPSLAWFLRCRSWTLAFVSVVELFQLLAVHWGFHGFFVVEVWILEIVVRSNF